MKINRRGWKETSWKEALKLLPKNLRPLYSRIKRVMDKEDKKKRRKRNK